MELDELRQMSAADLAVKEREVREEVFRLRLKLRTNQLDYQSGYQKARKRALELQAGTQACPSRNSARVAGPS